MKCPKCGYVSFDHLDHCKKCDQDLAEHKTRFGLGGLFTRRKTSPPTPRDQDPSAEKREEPTDFGFEFNDSSAAGGEKAAEDDFGPTAQRDSDPSPGGSAAFQATPDLRGAAVESRTQSGAFHEASPPLPGERNAGPSGEGLPDLAQKEERDAPNLFSDDLPPLPSTPGVNDGTLDQPLEVEGEESFDFSLEWDKEKEPDSSPGRRAEKKERTPSESASSDG